MLPKERIGEIKRIYPEEPKEINKKENEANMGISMPILMIGYKDNLEEDKVKEQIAIEIIANSLLGKTSKMYQELYEAGLLMSSLDVDYEFSDEYAHVVIAGESKEPRKVYEKVQEVLKNDQVSKEDFERSKKKIYGEYVAEYNDVENIGRMFLQDSLRNINSLSYIEKFDEITLEYVNEILEKLFKSNESVVSIVR